jgi:hypothetical protein
MKDYKFGWVVLTFMFVCIIRLPTETLAAKRSDFTALNKAYITGQT